MGFYKKYLMMVDNNEVTECLDLFSSVGQTQTSHTESVQGFFLLQDSK